MPGVGVLILIGLTIVLLLIILIIEKNNQNNLTKRKKDSLIVTAGIFTLLWMILIYLLAHSSPLIEDMKQIFGIRADLKLNAWGDYLAGFFAPIIFLWLVFGVYIQKKEFQNAVDEYKKTIDILKKQSEHTDIQHKNNWYDRNTEILEKYIDKVEKDSIAGYTSIEEFATHINSSTIDSFKKIMIDIKSIFDINRYITSSLDDITDRRTIYSNAILNLQKEYKILYGKQIRANELIFLKILLKIYLSIQLIDDEERDMEEREVLKQEFKDYYKNNSWINNAQQSFLNNIVRSEDFRFNSDFIDVMSKYLQENDKVKTLLYSGG